MSSTCLGGRLGVSKGFVAIMVSVVSVVAGLVLACGGGVVVGGSVSTGGLGAGGGGLFGGSGLVAVVLVGGKLEEGMGLTLGVVLGGVGGVMAVGLLLVEVAGRTTPVPIVFLEAVRQPVQLSTITASTIFFM